VLRRIDISAEEGFADFGKNDDGLDNQPIRMMSQLTQRMMQGIDYDAVANHRRENFENLHAALNHSNELHLELASDAIPMVYPYLTSVEELRERLIENKVFVARYWPNVLDQTTKGDTENHFAYQMQPLPIDQRYGAKEIKRIVDIINQ
jgi:hypothetical protein